MVIIRLARAGATKRPFYYIVVTDSRNPRDGRFIEKLGYFNPLSKGQALRLRVDTESVKSWVAKGAQLSERVAYLLKHEQELAATPVQTAAAAE